MKAKSSKPKIGQGDYGSTEFIGAAVAYKSSWQAEACGSVDELNAIIGEACARIQNGHIKEILIQIAKDLFVLGTEIANTKMAKKDLPKMTPRTIHHLEDLISEFENGIPPIHHFVVPIGPPSFTILHHARTVCRRAERQLVKYMKNDKTDSKSNPLTLAYLNRLGDLLFVIARTILKESDAPEIFWSRKDT